MRRTWFLAVAVSVVGAISGPLVTPAVLDESLRSGPSTRPVALRQLRFEENRGQAGSNVRYLVRDGDPTLYLTPGEAVLQLPTLEPANSAGSALVQMQFVGGSATQAIDGYDQLPGITNYLLGNDPAAWHVGIPSFARVAYRDVYPGVDAVFHGDQGALEYDLVLAPGADPTAIRLAFTGTRSVALGADGGLLLTLPGGVLRQDPPDIYQLVDGQRLSVSGGYVLDELNRVSFNVGVYERTLPLVIDPVIGYSTYLGGEHSDLGNAIAVDSSGNVYVTGQTDSAIFPTENAFDPSIGGGTCGFGFPCRDAFVTKLSPAGNDVIYSTYLGGNSDDMGRGIAVDASGNAYVTGNTASTNFPVQNAIQSSFGGGTCGETGCTGDAFITKLAADGTSLVYSTYLGGFADDQGNGVAVDSANRAYVVGFTHSPTFPTSNAFQPALAGVRDGFVSRLAASGASFGYSTFLGGNETGFDLREAANAVAVDSVGSAYVSGETTAQDFPIHDAFQPVCGGNCAGSRSDAFVTKFRPNGRALAYSTYLGGYTDEGSMGFEQGLGIAVNSQREAFVTGFTSSRDFPVATGAFQETFGGGDGGVGGDAFVTRFSAAGSTVRYSTYLGGRHDDTGLGIAVDGRGGAYVVGYTDSDNFPIRHPLQAQLRGDLDAFVTRLNEPGSGLTYSTYLGGRDGDVIAVTIGNGIALDAARSAYVAGWTNTTDFPIQGGFQESLQGEYDTFVTKILPS